MLSHCELELAQRAKIVSETQAQISLPPFSQVLSSPLPTSTIASTLTANALSQTTSAEHYMLCECHAVSCVSEICTNYIILQ